MSPRSTFLIAVSCLAIAGCSQHAKQDVAPMAAPMEPPGAVVAGWEPRGDIVRTEVHGGWGEPHVLPVGMEPGPRAVAETDGDYLLDTGDRLRVFVYGQPNLSRLYTVDHEGYIVVPLIGKVQARGSSVYALAARIRSRLAAEYVRDPKVTVDINQNRPFFIMGEVRQGGQFPYVSGMTVKTAIAIAGGYSERATKKAARITRRVNGMVEVLEVPSVYVIKPGDVIEVPERFF